MLAAQLHSDPHVHTPDDWQLHDESTQWSAALVSQPHPAMAKGWTLSLIMFFKIIGSFHECTNLLETVTYNVRESQ